MSATNPPDVPAEETPLPALALPPTAPRSSRRSTLLRKGLLIILLPVVAQGVLFLFLLGQQRHQERAQERAVHTKEVLGQLDHLLQSLLTAQVDLRGRLLGLPAGVETQVFSVPAFETQLETITQLVADNPAQQQRLAVLRATVAERMAWETQARGSLAAERLDEARRQFNSQRGADLMEQIRAQIGTMRLEEEQLDAQRLANLRQITRRQNAVVLGALIATVVVAALAMWLFSRSVARRISTLTGNIERLKRGEPLEQQMRSRDELGALDESFHTMATALAEARRRDAALQRTIEVRNEELTRANRDLAQKNEENEMFVYSVSHDLRSPLVNLQGFSRELGLVRDDLRALFDGDSGEDGRVRGRQLIDREVSESIRYIQTAVMRLSTIIDALLRLSRAGRVEYRPQQVPLGPIAERIVAAMRDSISGRRAQVSIAPLPTVWGDAAALEQIFANLIGNAVNYLDPERPGVIEIGAEPEKPDAPQVCYVRDNGLGIATAYLPKVFAVFQRLHATMAPGEGIGLALVRRAVERHGGRIWVQSTEGAGSTFFVELPREENSPLKLVPKKETLSVRTFQPTPAPPDHV